MDCCRPFFLSSYHMLLIILITPHFVLSCTRILILLNFSCTFWLFVNYLAFDIDFWATFGNLLEIFRSTTWISQHPKSPQSFSTFGARIKLFLCDWECIFGSTNNSIDLLCFTFSYLFSSLSFSLPFLRGFWDWF